MPSSLANVNAVPTGNPPPGTGNVQAAPPGGADDGPFQAMARLLSLNPEELLRQYTVWRNLMEMAGVRREANIRAWSNPAVKLSRPLPPIPIWDGKNKARLAEPFLTDILDLDRYT